MWHSDGVKQAAVASSGRESAAVTFAFQRQRWRQAAVLFRTCLLVGVRSVRMKIISTGARIQQGRVKVGSIRGTHQSGHVPDTLTSQGSTHNAWN